MIRICGAGLADNEEDSQDFWTGVNEAETYVWKTFRAVGNTVARFNTAVKAGTDNFCAGSNHLVGVGNAANLEFRANPHKAECEAFVKKYTGCVGIVGGPVEVAPL